MGKTMSTAKTVGRGTTIVKVSNEAAIQKKPNQEIVQRVQPTQPGTEYLKKANTFDNSFNDRLKQVFVTSVNNNPNMDVLKESLPQDRTTPYARTPHSQEIEQKEPNTLLITDIKMILINFRANPEKWTLDYIASRFDISKEIAGTIVKNYGTLETYYGRAKSNSGKSTDGEEHEKRITPETTLYEMEDIVASKKKKWLTTEEAEARWRS